MENEELHDAIDKLLCDYSDVKRMVKQENPYFYERWKAGGFLIDEDIMSMYPSLGELIQ